ncbi:response regulator transcription factor [Bdellovibrio bacteriovorus]|uniref:Two component response regulator n=1 Tax=Bdellovibrio bacteriovorus (strain ATCC 15356 / DSM 50701 / NCIMB 9529 / HD100) TaxID=264462 RepID=Q6MQN2_BDEBA|nr:response regulator transcription factor [Bdellovibrio bacteriovorus]AHZ86048.1 two component response regulator [Bdellovibrio bacteriovorus]BEV66973.1 Swarming motility regulation protein RssB [Bdellovibrio bacteriovorus]CAE78415.1 two component response regulator [Bdellovibrio bacteriovorus HD100]
MEKKILLVDDNKDFALLFQAKFSHLGKIECASTFAEAMRLIHDQSWDLFFLDHTLDEHTCFELIPAIRERSPRAFIMIVSGNADKEMAIRAVNSGVSGFLEKPINESDLQNRLAAIGWYEAHISLDDKNRSIYVSGNSHSLTKVEYMILRILMDKKNQLVTRIELEENIWGGRHIVKNSLDTHLYNLKRKVPELKGRLSSIHGTGYLLKI